MLAGIYHNWQGLICLLKCGKQLRNKISDFLPKYKQKLLSGFLSFIVNEALQVNINVVEILVVSYIYRLQIKEPRVRIYKTKLVSSIQT